MQGTFSLEKAGVFDKLASAITNYKDRCVVAVGGLSKVSNKVYRYTLATDTWIEMRSLNEARRLPSVCTLGDSVYVIGGEVNGAEERETINSIERLSGDSEQLAWKLIELSERSFEPRYSCTPVPINSHEIAIIGGLRYEEESTVDDVALFDKRGKA